MDTAKMKEVWYSQCNPTSWVAYGDNGRAIWEASTELELLQWLRANAQGRAMRIMAWIARY